MQLYLSLLAAAFEKDNCAYQSHFAPPPLRSTLREAAGHASSQEHASNYLCNRVYCKFVLLFLSFPVYLQI